MSNNFPLVTFVLLAYNQEEYISAAVYSALSQDYQNLEIILSDDCSSDSTFEIMSAVAAEYSGDHVVKVLRNPENLGLVGHFNEALGRSSGEIIVLAAGDDISLPERVSESVNIMLRFPGAAVVAFSDIVMDSRGALVKKPKKEKPMKVLTLSDFLGRRGPSLSGASKAFRRDVFLRFGCIGDQCPTEDSTMTLRSLMLGYGIRSGKSLIKYRVHDKNLSGIRSLPSLSVTGICNQYIRDAHLAKAEGLIDEGVYDRVVAFAVAEAEKRTFRNDLINGGVSLPRWLRFLLSARFPVREKISALSLRVKLVFGRFGSYRK